MNSRSNTSSNPNLNRTTLNRTDLNILNILHNMYTSNNQLIDRLLTSNNEIIHSIQQILNNPTSNPLSNPWNNQTPSTQRNQRIIPNRYTNIPVTETSNNTLNNLLFSFPDIPRTSFILDYMEPNQEIEQILDNFLNPVPIGVSLTQLENSTSLIRFSEIIEPRNSSCPISLEPFQGDDYVIVIKYCGHVFYSNEIYHWFESNVRCPVCRYDIRNYREVNPPTSTNSRRRNTSSQRNTVRNNELINELFTYGFDDNNHPDVSNNTF